jgi:hypothetical protein
MGGAEGNSKFHTRRSLLSCLDIQLVSSGAKRDLSETFFLEQTCIPYHAMSVHILAHEVNF